MIPLSSGRSSTPWEYDREQLTLWQVDVSDDGDQECDEIANNVDPENGEFIVRAVNSHDALVKACKAAFRGDEYHELCKEALKQALN